MRTASGYGGLENTPLIREGYYDKIIANVWQKDYIPAITNTQISERLTQCNQTVNFLRAPNVGSWRKYDANQQIIADQVSPDSFQVTICNPIYKALKFEQYDISRACEMWTAWEAEFLEGTYQTLTGEFRSWLLGAMILETDFRNKGNGAGKFGNIDLGQPGAPIPVTGDNIVNHLARLRRVLEERNRWVQGKMFVLVPPIFTELIATSKYADAAFIGNCNGCSMLVEGQLPGTLFGFKIIQANDLPQVIDPTQELASYIIAGHEDAFLFAGDVIEARVVNPSDSFSVQYQMLANYGGGALYPDALAVGYWSLQP